MSVTVHQRPGVYSTYDASRVVNANAAGRLVALVGVNTVAPVGVAQKITSYERAVALFGAGDGEGMTQLIWLALKNGAAGVVAVPVADSSGYVQAFTLLEGMEDIAVVICDSHNITVQQGLRASVLAAAKARRERIAVVAGARDETVSALLERAKAMNSERVALVAPGSVESDGSGLTGLGVAAAVAGAIAGERDPSTPLGGATLYGLNGLAQQYGDLDLDLLILGGVTPVESMGGTVSVVRGVTTRTKTGEAPDATWRELSTIRVIDDVIPTIRAALRSKFQRAKNTKQSRSAIRSQVVLELENKLSREIITGYEDVVVQADTQEPTRCLVDFSFTVTHGLNQIWLMAHITV